MDSGSRVWLIVWILLIVCQQSLTVERIMIRSDYTMRVSIASSHLRGYDLVSLLSTRWPSQRADGWVMPTTLSGVNEAWSISLHLVGEFLRFLKNAMKFLQQWLNLNIHSSRSWRSSNNNSPLAATSLAQNDGDGKSSLLLNLLIFRIPKNQSLIGFLGCNNFDIKLLGIEPNTKIV